MKLNDKIKFALDEGRVLILGGQVLIGFGYQSFLQPRFARLPSSSQYVQLVSLVLMLLALASVMCPAARDALVERGIPTRRYHRFATRMIGCGLLPFALGLGTSTFVAVRMVAGPVTGIAVGICAFLLSASLWYGGCIVAPGAPHLDKEENESVELKDKIEHALTETRMVLPGVQALLGFQFIGMLTDAFAQLPRSSQYVHVVSLCLSAVTISFLITPAAFHRTVEHGETTERQHRVTTRFLLAAMATLPAALVGDLFVVLRRVAASPFAATILCLAMMCVFYGLWFGWSVVANKKHGIPGLWHSAQ